MGAPTGDVTLKGMCDDFHWLIYWHTKMYNTAVLICCKTWLFLLNRQIVYFRIYYYKELKGHSSNAFYTDIIEML